MTRECPLVLVEWVDSSQPVSSWKYLTDYLEEQNTIAVKCVSVGWLIQDTEVKMLAPNFGDVLNENEDRVQVSGVIRIPARAVINITKLDEPGFSPSFASYSSFGPSSHPDQEPTLPTGESPPE